MRVLTHDKMVFLRPLSDHSKGTRNRLVRLVHIVDYSEMFLWLMKHKHLYSLVSRYICIARHLRSFLFCRRSCCTTHDRTLVSMNFCYLSLVGWRSSVVVRRFLCDPNLCKIGSFFGLCLTVTSCSTCDGFSWWNCPMTRSACGFCGSRNFSRRTMFWRWSRSLNRLDKVTSISEFWLEIICSWNIFLRSRVWCHTRSQYHVFGFKGRLRSRFVTQPAAQRSTRPWSGVEGMPGAARSS